MTDGHTFVCYAREDTDFVRALTADLRVRGIPMWLDTDIPAGVDWDRSIDERVRTCANVLIVLSPAAVTSAEVRGELRTSLNLGKPIIPLLYRPCDIPRQLQNVQYLDFSTDAATDAGRDDLAGVLQSRPHVEGPGQHRRGGPVGRALRNRRDFLDDVKSEVEGRLAQSLHAGTLNILKEKQPEQVTRRWDAEVKMSDPQRTPLSPDVGIVQVFDDETIAGKLLILGAPGSGKTTTLIDLNVGVFALLGGLIVGLPYGTVNIMAGVIGTRVAPNAWDWVNLVVDPAVLFGLLGALVPGAACIQHFALRCVLSCCGLAPLRYARFLNFATERMLLQRVGGRYRFIHALLRDHCAAMPPDSAKG